MHLFVYYDVPWVAVATARVRVLTMQAEVHGPAARLMTRTERRADGETWMEIYADAPDDLESRLAIAVDRHGIAALTGARHVERFEDVFRGSA